MTGGAGSSGAGGSGGAQFDPLSEKEMAKLRRGNIVWNYITAGQYVGDQSKVYGDRKLRCNLCGHLFQGGSLKAARHFTQSKFYKAGGMRVLVELWNGTDYRFVPSTAQRVQRWMADEGIRDTRAPAGGQRQRMDNAERDDIQDALDEEEGREGGAREGAVADEADEAVGEPNLPGEEVVMTSRGVGGAGPATRAPRGEVERARREKRTVGQAGVEVPDTGREKRAWQTTIVEMYAREKLAEFHNAWLQWIYVKKLPFNAFRGPEFQRVRQAAERVPRSIQFRFPSFRVTAGAGIPSQRAKVATMVSEVRATFRHCGATILLDGRKSRSGKPLVNFLAGGANGALLYATVARDGSVRDTTDVVYRRWRAIILSFPAKDVIGFCTDSASNYTAAARRFATDPEPDIRRITWLPCSTHVCNLMLSDIGTRVVWVKETVIRARALVRFIKSHGATHALFRKLMRRVDVPTDMIEPCVREVAIRNLHMLEPAHVVAHLLNPRRRSLTYYHSLQTTADDRLVVEGCDRFLLVQTDGDPVGLLYRNVRDQMRAFHSRRGDWGDREPSDAKAADCRGDSETERCAAWWFEHGRAHPELRTITIRVMHLWTSASPAERNWAEHERVSTARRCKLGFAKLAQLVEIATNLKLASCARQGGGYVLPWVNGSGRGGTAAKEEDEEGDVEPEVWGARPDGSVPEQEIQRQIVAFRDSRPSRARSVRDVFGSRVTKLRPWLEGGDDVDAAAADDDIDDDWTDDDDTPLSRDPMAERVYFTYGGGRDGTNSFISVITSAVPSTAPASGSSRASGGHGGRSHAEDFEDIGLGGSLADLSIEERRRASPQNVRTDADVERGPVETEEERDARLDREEEERLRDLETGGEGSCDLDDSGVPEEAVQGEFDYEGQDAAAGVLEGQDVVMGGGSPSGGHGDSETVGDEGQGAAGSGRGEGGPGGDGDTAGVGGDDGPDDDDDDDHGPEDDPRKSGKQWAPGRVYSPPPFTVQSPHWSGSSLSDVRGRESGAGEVGSGRRSDGSRDSAGSMPPPPARTPEGRVDTGDRTVAPGVAHSGGSPPPVRGGVGGGWSAVHRVGDRLRADYDATRGVFTGRAPVQTQAAEGGSERPSLQMAGRMLGLSRAETRTTLVLEAPGTSTDRLRGEQFTLGEEGLLMRPGTRRQHGLSEVEARLDAGVAAGHAALDAIQRERERGIAAQAEEDEDADTESEPVETVARRYRAQVAAAAAAAHAAYVTWTRTSEHPACIKYLELLILQAWRTDVEGDLLGFLFGSVRPGNREPITQELVVPPAQLADDLSLDIVSQSDNSPTPHVITRALAPYLQWTACLEEHGSESTLPSRQEYLKTYGIIDRAFYPKEDPEEALEGEEESIEEEGGADEETSEEGSDSEYSKGEQSEEEEEEEEAGSEWEALPEEAARKGTEAEDPEAARRREEIAVGKSQLEFASEANLRIDDDPTRDPEPPEPEDGGPATAAPSASRRRRSRSPSPSTPAHTPVHPRTDAGNWPSSPVIIPPSP
ncbi:hypothetical protein CBR_g3335 [Chara braunii]|uniref:DUF659 domain-containing protein n=1 Tax=Chara braunii TaxID=69332 RepID=A0A388KFG1_CHABU|nr:hypothetical protein CBR_g3335 [Chara braunii]|eukprot:GBG68795.1 hypothetical protein CBR_g3335 [Chara braunii]